MRWILVLVLWAGTAQAQDARLTKVLAQLDAASTRFGSAQASFRWDQLTVAVDEHDVQTGTIAFRRGAKGPEMAAHVLEDNGSPAKKDVLYVDRVLKLYQPGIKQETDFRTGANSSQFESYSTLGFGGSGKDLQANWTVGYVGTEMVDGVSVAHLSLVPKNAGPNPLFTKVEIWIDPVTATSRKQVFYAPGGDNRTATYTNIVLDKARDADFTLKVPKETTIFSK